MIFLGTHLRNSPWYGVSTRFIPPRCEFVSRRRQEPSLSTTLHVRHNPIFDLFASRDNDLCFETEGFRSSLSRSRSLSVSVVNHIGARNDGATGPLALNSPCYCRLDAQKFYFKWVSLMLSALGLESGPGVSLVGRRLKSIPNQWSVRIRQSDVWRMDILVCHHIIYISFMCRRSNRKCWRGRDAYTCSPAHFVREGPRWRKEMRTLQLLWIFYFCYCKRWFEEGWASDPL